MAIMSKREDEKAIEATKKVAEEAKSAADKHEAARTLQEIEGQETAQQFQESIQKSLDETRNNVKKSIDESKSQIPRYTEVVKNYQEKSLQATREMVVDYIEAQKTIMNSLFNSTVWVPYFENSRRIYDFWFSPKLPVEIYARAVSNIADNIAATARLTNNVIFGNIDAFGNAFQRVQENTKELSRINVNTAKAFEDTARETSRSTVSVNREGYIR